MGMAILFKATACVSKASGEDNARPQKEAGSRGGQPRSRPYKNSMDSQSMNIRHRCPIR
jgi:hypothetical protein